MPKQTNAQLKKEIEDVTFALKLAVTNSTKLQKDIKTLKEDVNYYYNKFNVETEKHDKLKISLDSAFAQRKAYISKAKGDADENHALRRRINDLTQTIDLAFSISSIPRN